MKSNLSISLLAVALTASVSTPVVAKSPWFSVPSLPAGLSGMIPMGVGTPIRPGLNIPIATPTAAPAPSSK